MSLHLARDFPRLPVEVELVVYWIVQEALSNIAGHSGSDTGEVRLLHRRAGSYRRVHVTIVDFGKGIPWRGGRKPHHYANGGAGIGLESMRERVNQIGGELRIRSAPGRTSVTAVIPADV